MERVVEIITGRERRRRWGVAEKLSLVAETQEPGSSVRGVAVRHGLCESLLFTWRRQMREGVLRPEPEMPAFLPVHMIEAPRTVATLPSPPAPAPTSSTRSKAAPGVIEIELGNGQHLRVGNDVSLAALRRVLAALRE
jgi:transposase